MDEQYTASRWTSGNHLFPDRVSVRADGVHYVKRRLIGSTEETINVRQISSIRLETGLLFATLTIETSGGSQPVIIHGLRKADAQRVQTLIQNLQGQAARP